MSFAKGLGISFLTTGLLLILFIFAPAAGEEIRYRVGNREIKNQTLSPVDGEFGIVIPKIGANAKIIADVDPNNPREYQQALTRGIAHAKGTKWFFFAHSAGNWLEASRYNAIFYLLSKLEKDDEIWIFIKNKKSVYRVVNKEVVDGENVDYMRRDKTGETITLMTCWPPGTTFKRLVVAAKLSYNED